MVTSELIRAAAYGRFSTENQNERSADDQIDLCRAFAKRERFTVVATYADRAISGASMHGRHELQRMIKDAHAGKFEVIIVEAMDRLSRTMAHLATLYEQLLFIGVRIVAVNDGEANTINIALRGLVAQLFREDNVHKVKRGMAGLIKQQLTAGGKAFGYRPDPANPGKPIIVPEEAATVLRIFSDYASGKSPKAICKALTAEYVKPPRGNQWSPSALIGFAPRGTGMLRNRLYAGEIVWNKVRMVKDPNTGKRLSRPNPESEWKTAEVPELRVVPQELFDVVRTQMAERAHGNRTDNIGVHKRPMYLLSGLLRCGSCGSGMSRMGPDKSGRTRIRCSRHTNNKSCPDPRTFYADEVESVVISSLTKELATPDQIRVYAERYIKARVAEGATENRRRAEIKARIAAIAKDNDRLLDLLVAGKGDQDAVDARMKAQAHERDELKLELARLPDSGNVILHPTAIKAFADKLTNRSPGYLHNRRAKLEATLHLLDDMGELGPVVRELINAITLYRDDSDGSVLIRVEGHLTPFLNGPEPGIGSMVAEEGFEPPTQGL